MVKTNYTTNELYIQAMEIIELPDDIVKYTKLIKLDCIYNKLTSLDNLPPTLEILYCWNNQLTNLNNLPPKLKELYCNNNQLTSLDNLPLNLEILYCDDNQLTSLDNLPTTLLELHCDNNPFTYNFELTLKNIRNYNDSKLKI